MRATTPCSPLGIGSISLRLYPHDMAAVGQVTELRAQAVLAVEAGYDGVMVSEHHADFPGYLPNPTQLSQFLLAAMPTGWAAPCPLLLPMQPYALIAEQLAWLAAAYPGRVGAGFAAGALPVDFELAEVPFAEITERFKAAVPFIVAALRGADATPLGRDRALIRTGEHPIPMVLAAQSKPAVRRAASHQVGVLYDSLQTNEVSKRLSDAYDEAGGTAAKILIRRVWIGDPPTSQIDAQMAHYRSYAPAQAILNWGNDDQLVQGADGVEAAEKLAGVLRESNCNAVNVRVHLNGLAPGQVREQIDRHRTEFLPRLRELRV
jgi:alkanesulfonate monooxygenase SsuD/methylene tetrahydromethanopterin reductase-like flavin-dependent oxidoreductase (luciferase family)